MANKRDVVSASHRHLALPSIDILAIICGFIIVLGIVRSNPEFAAFNQIMLTRIGIEIVVTAGLVLFLRHLGHYQERRPFWQEAGEVIKAFVAAMAIEAAILFFFQIEASRLVVFGMWTVSCILVLTMRFLVKSWLMHQGLWTMPVVIVGKGRNARDLALAMLDEPVPAHRPIAFVSPTGEVGNEERLRLDEQTSLPVVGVGNNPFELLRRFARTRIIVALDIEDFKASKEFVDRLSRTHRFVDVVLPLRGLPMRRSYKSRFVNHDLTLMRVRRDFDARFQAGVKRAFDIVVVSCILLFLAPLFGILSLLVATSGRPIFFAHERIGRHGKPFKCLKFRSMAVDAKERLEEILRTDPAAAEEWRLTRKLKNDPRVTKIGAWLRKTSLDELPQLVNVLRGDMSLVGPRPVTHDEVLQYGEHRVYYMQNRPGITGLWQVSGRSDIDFQRRVDMDAFYVQNWSLTRDIMILFMTARVVFAREGAY
ncbi:undecaprenyl-phosphate galactose phosphotransferase WbaP [Arboricoccus pini]|nr:undecaprenyl-phosphate galactose phosphotransferase WbaP [Arboricoccus pini]